MKLWLDAQISPAMAAWLAQTFEVDAVPVRDIGLRDASDVQIFQAAKAAAAVLITKDSDFSHLIRRFGPPPQIIWLRCGNTSTKQLQRILKTAFPKAMDLLNAGEMLIEVTDFP